MIIMIFLLQSSITWLLLSRSDLGVFLKQNNTSLFAAAREPYITSVD